MERKDNDYETKTTGAEETVAVSDEKEQASTALKKFKDVDALEKAYNSLQAEFTRRSQKLKELERRWENLQSGAQEAEKVGVEKLRQNATARKREEKEFDDFVSEIESASVRAQKIDESEPTVSLAKDTQAEEKPDVKSEEKQASLVEKEKTQSFVATGSDVQSAETSSELYERAVRDESVRLKIIGEYLSSLKNAGAPIMKTGTGLFATPPMKAKSIAQAGNMALRFFKQS